MTNYFENCKTTEEVKATYKELTKKYHPDVYGEKGNDIMKEIHNQLEKAIKKVDSKLYNDIYNNTDREENEATRAKKEELIKTLYAQYKSFTYLYLFYYYMANGLRPYNHRNPITKHNFSGWNIWQLEVKAILEGYKSTKWSTFAQYKAEKNPVKKGEHGTYITLAIISKPKKKENAEEEQEEKETVFYKSYAVFNEEQTQNKSESVKMIETTKAIETKKEQKEEAAQKTLNLWANKYEIVA